MADEAAVIEPYLSDDVTVGAVIRWIDREHINAARETPPNLDYMGSMQRLGEHVESALKLYRAAKPTLSKKAVMADELRFQILDWLERNAEAEEYTAQGLAQNLRYADAADCKKKAEFCRTLKTVIGEIYQDLIE